MFVYFLSYYNIKKRIKVKNKCFVQEVYQIQEKHLYTFPIHNFKVN